jgi:hypothetical protein
MEECTFKAMPYSVWVRSAFKIGVCVLPTQQHNTNLIFQKVSTSTRYISIVDVENLC